MRVRKEKTKKNKKTIKSKEKGRKEEELSFRFSPYGNKATGSVVLTLYQGRNFHGWPISIYTRMIQAQSGSYCPDCEQ